MTLDYYVYEVTYTDLSTERKMYVDDANHITQAISFAQTDWTERNQEYRLIDCTEKWEGKLLHITLTKNVSRVTI